MTTSTATATTNTSTIVIHYAIILSQFLQWFVLGMDLTRIKSVILNQINGVTGLYSLQLQNHIYGCFVIMEDIAQSSVDVSGSELIYPQNGATPINSFDYDVKFSTIGLRYGFINSEIVTLNKYSDEYKDIWCECFRLLDLIQDIAIVDDIEDTLIELIKTTIPTSEGFFDNALETGMLNEHFIKEVLLLLEPPAVVTTVETPKNNNDSLNNQKSTTSHRNKIPLTRKKNARRLTPSVRKRVLQITRKNR